MNEKTPEARDFACPTCGAQIGDSCVTIRPRFGPTGRYRGQGVVALHIHRARLDLLVAARRSRSSER